MTVAFRALALGPFDPHSLGMTADFETSDFTGQLLVAMPGMGDPRFDRAVIFMCAHSPEGAMGLIVNKPAEDVTFNDLAEQLDISRADREIAPPVHFGGPVEHGRGFVLHSSEYSRNESTLAVGASFGMTATLDVLEHIAKGEGPSRAILALGYSGWGPGQLEGEIQENGWLLSKASHEIVFDLDNNEKWAASLRALGIDPITLSAEGGRA